VTGTHNPLHEKNIHLFFAITLCCKAILATLEIVAGVTTFIIPPEQILTFVIWITKHEFEEDPSDLIANALLHSAHAISLGSQRFVALYLLGHGVIKLWLIRGLLKRKIAYFPISILIFSLLVAYQIYRYAHTFSTWLLIFTALDICIIALSWQEFKYLKVDKRR
jgi:uncharacterized membrane protein